MLPNGAWMVGWGEAPYVSEFAPSGQLLFDAHLPATYESYRSYRLAWSGQPSEPPALAIVRGSRRGGATRLRELERRDRTSPPGGCSPAPRRARCAPAGGAARDGFETAIALPSLAPGSYVEVQALNAAGAVIGASAAKRA